MIKIYNIYIPLREKMGNKSTVVDSAGLIKYANLLSKQLEECAKSDNDAICQKVKLMTLAKEIELRSAAQTFDDRFRVDNDIGLIWTRLINKQRGEPHA
jgi:hypothetical protein